MPKRQIVLEVDDELADQLEKAGLLDDQEKLAEIFSRVDKYEKQAIPLLITFFNELRNHVTPIRGYGEILNKEMAGTLTDLQKQIALSMYQNASYADFLISETSLGMGKILGNLESVYKEGINLDTLLKRIISYVQSWQHKDAEPIHFQIYSPMPRTVGNEFQLQTVFISILHALYRYTSDFEITFSVTPQTTKVHLQLIIRAKQQMNVRIYMEQFFERFTAMDAIFASVIKAHRGDLWTEEIAATDTTIHITLPLTIPIKQPTDSK